jgi:hypothetical protein
MPGAGLVIKLIDKLPVTLYIGAYYNAVHPSQTGPSWQLRSQLTFILVSEAVCKIREL